jgi:hypothetical protein
MKSLQIINNIESKKVELGMNVELGLKEDLKAQFNKYFSVDNMDLLEVGIIDAIKKLNANYVATAREFDAFNKIYTNFQKKALDLGVEIPKDVIQYKDEVFKFMKVATEQHKKYLNIKL